MDALSMQRMMGKAVQTAEKHRKKKTGSVDTHLIHFLIRDV